MDPPGIGALIGSSIVFGFIIGTYIYDRCTRNQNVETRNPLLVKHRSFRISKLFKHVEF
jgi:hypothetical protein